jgi:hypothetical protein
MDAAGSTQLALVERSSRRWTADHRAAAFTCYYSTGSRRQARKQTGVPERTLSLWLRDPRYAQEREAVQAGLLQSVQQDAARRGIEVAEATREAILVCRKSLRRDPDGKTASSLLTALSRARETEDRIQRLDDGRATAIAGVALDAEDQEAFRAWHADHLERKKLTVAEEIRQIEESFERVLAQMVQPGHAESLRGFLGLVASSTDTVTHALRSDVELARRLHACTGAALGVAEEDAARGCGADAETRPPESPVPGWVS